MAVKSCGAEESKPRLRDLSASDFHTLYACDRHTASILVDRFGYVMKHMATKLRTTAFSPVIRDMDDFCTTISGPPELGWPVPATSLTNPTHWGTAADAVPIVLETYGLDTLRSGDIIMANDSYRTGKHLNDISFVQPIFHRGQLLGAIHITAHQLDIGSRVPGGFEVTNRTLWEDGLLIPPLALYRGGVPDRSGFNLLAANTRYPEIILADLEGIRSALNLGEQLLLATIERYGVEAYLAAMRYACDAASERMGDAMLALPDGLYRGEHIIDGDGLSDSPEYVVRVDIRKAADRMEIDFSGSSEASRTAINCSWLDVKTGVLIGLKTLIDRHSIPSSGALKNVDILLPPGSIINPFPPASTMFYFQVIGAIVDAITAALNPALGENALAGDATGIARHRAYGKRMSGERWQVPAISTRVGAYPVGATRAGDADAFALLRHNNFPNTGNELKEMSAPYVVMRIEAVIDSGGPGYNRGGAAEMQDIYWPDAGQHQIFTTQVKRPPAGTCGGHAGTAAANWLFDCDLMNATAADWLPSDVRGSLYRRGTPVAGVIDPDTNEASPLGQHLFQSGENGASAGSTSRYVSAGGGGWGDSMTREPERVLRDVRDEYVSIAGAARDYGVVVLGNPAEDPEGLRIDWDATLALRRAAAPRRAEK